MQVDASVLEDDLADVASNTRRCVFFPCQAISGGFIVWPFAKDHDNIHPQKQMNTQQ